MAQGIIGDFLKKEKNKFQQVEHKIKERYTAPEVIESILLGVKCTAGAVAILCATDSLLKNKATMFHMARALKPKSKAGKVYLGEVTTKTGRKYIYTGQTKRAVYKRVGEHMRKKNFRLLGSVYSGNRYKAEQTIKKMSPAAKRAIARKGARAFKKKS